MSAPIIAGTLVAMLLGGCMPPSWGAGALLHPYRNTSYRAPKRRFEALRLEGAGVRLDGWMFRAAEPPRGTVVFLHGVADNRSSSAGIAEHFVPRGFDVLSYDSRAHGRSDGDACTYGFHEKRDLMRVLDHVESRPIVLVGTSLGGAVSLQAAAEDPRVALVVAVATFSDLRTVATERAPFFASRSNVAEALRIAEDRASFRVDDVSPLAAAARITVPVLLIHGADDDETPPAHSLRVFAALGARKRLLLVPGAHHNDALTAEVWRAIDAWIDAELPRP